MPDRLSTTLSALADPTRRAILARLATGEATVNQLAEPFDISLPAVSRHLKVLQKAGLIAQGREAQWRPCRITPAPLDGRVRLGGGLPRAVGAPARPARGLPERAAGEAEADSASQATELTARLSPT